MFPSVRKSPSPSFTCSAAAIHSALRLFGPAAANEVLAWDHTDQPSGGQTEFYGESAARPVFSAAFDGDPARSAALAAAGERLLQVSFRFGEFLEPRLAVDLDRQRNSRPQQ